MDSQNVTTDIYAVGILLYQLLVGKVPFDGEMAEVLEMQLNKKMPLQNVKQRQIRDVINTATQKKRSQRFQSAAEFRVAVDKLMPLDYPGRTIAWRKIGIILGSAAVFAGLVIGVIKIINNIISEPDKDGTGIPPIVVADNKLYTNKTEEQNIPQNSYAQAVLLLSNKQTANDGLEMLKLLADEKNYHAAFLLSRLYFNSNESIRIGTFSDSVTLFRNNLGITAQNGEAHRLLKEAIAINPNDYHSLFELGCDYKSKKRGATFNPDSAYIYLNKAKQLATKAGDHEYMQAIYNRMVNLKPAK